MERGGGGVANRSKEEMKTGKCGENWSKQMKEIQKLRIEKEKKIRPGRRSSAGRFTSILPLTVLLTIGCKAFSLTLINVTTHSWFINTSIIRLSITLPSGLAEPESYSSCTSLLMYTCSQFSSRLKTKQHNRPAGKPSESKHRVATKDESQSCL